MNARWFEYITLFLIFGNMVFMGIVIDYGGPGESAERIDSGSVFGILNLLFSVFFTFEILLRVLSYPSFQAYLFDPLDRYWNWFDVVFLLIIDLETWVFPYVIPDEYTHVTRPLRLLRFLRVLRVFRMYKPLRSMVRAVAASVSACTALLLFQLLFIYAMAIVYVNWVLSTKSLMTDSETADFFYEHFGSTYRGMLTFFQILIVDDAFDSIRFVLDHAVWVMGAFLLVYLAVSTWMVYNVLIGLICQVVFDNTDLDERTNAEQTIRAWLKPYGDSMTRADWDNSLPPRKSLDSEKLESARVLARNGDVIDTNQVAEVYVKLLRPIQAVDILACQAELELLYTKLDLYQPLIANS